MTKINVRMEDETVWLTQQQLVELYQSSKENVSEHIKHIFEEGELDEKSVVRKFRTTAIDEKNYNMTYYNLDMIISLGYRIKSSIATQFRRWATSVDYDPKSEDSIKFFKIVQNKLHFAAHGHTAAEVIYERVDADKLFMELTSFSGEIPALKDISVAKNYLKRKNRKNLFLHISRPKKLAFLGAFFLT